MNKLIQYLKETRNELKEVVFPTSSQTITFTILVIIISIAVAVTLGGTDSLLNKGLKMVVAGTYSSASSKSVSTSSTTTGTIPLIPASTNH